jgi:hypothetical protein
MIPALRTFAFEPLEPRTLLSVGYTTSIGTGTELIAFTGGTGDNLFLETDSSNILRYSTDGTNFTSAGFVVFETCKITAQVGGTVTLEAIASAGNSALTIDATSSNSALMAPVTVQGSISTGTGTLEIDSDKTIEVQSSATLSTGTTGTITLDGRDVLVDSGSSITAGTVNIDPDHGNLAPTFVGPTANIDAAISASHVNVTGDSASDNINVQATGSGETLTISHETNTTGAYLIAIGSTAGNTITSAGTLAGILGPISVSGAGNDTLNVDNSGSNAATTSTTHMTLSASSLSVPGSAAISYGNIAALNVNLAQGADFMTVTGTSATSGTAIYGGSKENTFTASEPLAQPLALNGFGTTPVPGDSLTVNGVSGVDNFAVTGSYLTDSITQTTGPAISSVISYSGIPNLTVNADGGADSITVVSDGAADGTTLNGSGGNVTFNVDSSTNPLTINGGTGQDTINVYGNSNPLMATGSSGGTSFNVFGNSSMLTLAGVAGTNTFDIMGNSSPLLSMTGGSGTNAFIVQSTSAALTVNCAGMSSTITAYAPVGAPLTLNGNGASSTKLVVVGADGGDFLTITAHMGSPEVQGAGSAIDYPGIGALEVDGGYGKNTINVLATAVPMTVQTSGQRGSGSIVNVDSFTPSTSGAFSAIAAPLTITGSGNDTVNVGDTGDGGSASGVLTGSMLSALNSAGTLTYSKLAALNLYLGSSGTGLAVQGTAKGTTTTVDTTSGGSANAFTVGSQAPSLGGTLAAILGPLVLNGAGSDTLTVDDSGAAGNLSGKLTPLAVTGLGMGTGASVTYGGLAAETVDLGTGTDTFTVTGTSAAATTTINTAGNATVNIRATGGPTAVANAGPGTTTVNVGSTTGATPAAPGNLAGIAGLLTVTGNGADVLNVDETGGTATSGTLSGTTLTGLGMPGTGITYTGLATMVVALGPGGNTFGVTGTTASTSTTVSTGSGSDTVNVTGTTAPLTINTSAGNAAVNIKAVGGTTNVTNTGAGTTTIVIGSTAPNSGGTVAAIKGAVTVQGGSSDSLTIDDSGATSGVSPTITTAAVTSLIPGGAVSYSGLASLTVSLGSGGDKPTIAGTATGTTTTLNTGGGNDTVYVQAVGGPTAVNTGAGTDSVNVGSTAPSSGGNLTGIVAPLSVAAAAGGATTLNVDDIGNPSAATGALSASALTGLDMIAPGQINYSGLTALNISLSSANNSFTINGTASGTTTTLNTGNGNDTVSVKAAGGATAINTGTGTDSVNVGSLAPSTGGLLTGIQATLTVAAGGSATTLNVDNTGDTIGETGALSATALTGFGMGGPVDDSGLKALNINLGNHGNIVTITGTAADATTTLNTGSGNNTVYIQAVGGSTTVNTGTGTNIASVGSTAGLTPAAAGNVAGIQASLSVTAGGAATTLNVDDTGNSSAATGTLSASALSGLDMGAVGQINYSGLKALNISLGNAGNSVTVTGTAAGTTTTLNTGNGNDTVSIQATGGPTTVNTGNGNDTVYVQAVGATTVVNTGTGTDTVDVGSTAGPGSPAPGNLAGIQAALTVAAGGTATTLNVDDTGNTNPATGTLSASALTGLDMGSSGQINYSGLSALNIALKNKNDTFTITGTASGTTTTLNTGNGNDTVNVRAVGGATKVKTATGTDTVNVGSNAPGTGGNLAGIQAALTVTAGGTATTLNVDDTGNSSPATGTLSGSALTGLDMGAAGQINYSGLKALNVNLGNANDTFNVQAVSTSTTVKTGTGIDTVNVGSNAPGAGGNLAGIQAALMVTAGGTATTLNLDDTGNSSPATGSLSSSVVSGLDMGAAGQINYSGLKALKVNLGSANDTFNVQAVSTATTVTTGTGTDTVNVGSNAPGAGGNLAGIQAALTVTAGGTATKLYVDDTGNSSPAIGTLSASALTGLDMGTAGQIGYSGLKSLIVNLGNGGGAFTIAGTAAGTTTTLNAGSGSDTINVQAVGGPTAVNTGAGTDTVNVGSNAPGTGGVLAPIAAALTLTGGGGADILNLDDTGDTKAASGTVSPTMVTGFGMLVGVTYSGFAALNLNLGTGANTVTVIGVNPSTVTTVNGGGNASSTITLSTPGDFTGTLDASGFGSASVTVLGNFAGTFDLGGPINVTSVTIGGNFTGQLITGGTITAVSITGTSSGLISAGAVGTITASAASGALPLQVVEGGILRRIEVTPTGSFTYPTLKYDYQSTAAGVSVPQVAIRVTSPGSGPFDLELATYNATVSGAPVSHDGSAKFDLTWLDSPSGASGLHDLGVEGDLLITPTTAALGFLSASGTGGVKLPSDALGSVATWDLIAEVSIGAKSVQAIAFGQYAEEGGQVMAASTAQTEDATDMLTSTTKVAAASGILRAPFGSANAVAVFLGTSSAALSSSTVLLTDENAQDPNAPAGSSGTSILAALTVTAGTTPTVSLLGLSGDGGSVSTALPVTSVTSTGDLGDLTLSATSAVTNVTASSVFGSVSLGGNLTGIFQTTGQRIDPISLAGTSVIADLGRLYTSAGVLKATTFSVKGLVTAPSGSPASSAAIISRGNLVSAVSISGTGTTTGVIAAQGNLGASSGSTRYGGVTITGVLGGQVVALKNIIGDITVSGGMKSGRIAAEGSIVGNVTVSNGLDSASAIVGRLSICGGSYGTAVNLSGTVAGFVASEGTVALGSKTSLKLGSTLFNSSDAGPGTASAAAIDAVFEDGGVLISSLDKTTPGDLNELTTVLLPHLLKLKVSSGALTDS